MSGLLKGIASKLQRMHWKSKREAGSRASGTLQVQFSPLRAGSVYERIENALTYKTLLPF